MSFTLKERLGAWQTSNEPTCDALFLLAVPDLDVWSMERKSAGEKDNKWTEEGKNTHEKNDKEKIPSISVCALTSFCRIY